MSKANNLGDFLAGVADAIRAKTGSSDLIDPQDFETEIANIPSGGGGSVTYGSMSLSTMGDFSYTGTGQKKWYTITNPNKIPIKNAYSISFSTGEMTALSDGTYTGYTNKENTYEAMVFTIETIGNKKYLSVSNLLLGNRIGYSSGGGEKYLFNLDDSAIELENPTPNDYYGVCLGVGTSISVARYTSFGVTSRALPSPITISGCWTNGFNFEIQDGNTMKLYMSAQLNTF